MKPFGGMSGSGSGVEAEKGGFTHLDLPTLLGDREIAVDVEHWGPYVGLKVNGWQRVGFADVLSKDGVIQVMNRVLIPPRRLAGGGVLLDGEERKGEMELEEFKQRLKPWVDGRDDEMDAVADL